MTRLRAIADSAGEYLPVLIFAAFLAPTRLNTLRGSVLPEWFSPYHLMAIAVFATCLWIALRTKPFEPPPRMLWMPMAGLGLVMSAGLWWSDAPLYGREKVLDFWALSLVGGLAPWYIFRDEASVRRFFYSLIVFATVLASILFIMFPPWRYWHRHTFDLRIGSNYLLIQQMGGLGALALLFVALREDTSLRQGAVAITLLGGVVVLPGAFMAGEIAVIIASSLMGLGAAYWWLGRGRLWGRRAPYVALLITILVAVLHAGGKGPVLFLGISIAGLSTLLAFSDTGARGIWRWRRPLAYVVLLAGVMGIMMAAFGYSRVLMRAAAYWDWFVAKPSHFLRHHERILNLQQAWDMFAANPFLGAGPGSFSAHAAYIPTLEQMKYPHNIIIESLAEEGLMGAGLVLVLVGYALWMLYRLHRRGFLGPLPLAALGCLGFVFLCAQTSGDINNVALFGLAGLAHAMERFSGPQAIAPKG